jgi:PST family polysaccharide transporter
MDLFQRSVTSVSWTGAATLLRTLVSFLRFVLLARMLPVEVFGIYVLSVSIVKLTVVVTRYGLDWAFLHRARATRDEEEAAAVYFTVRLILLLLWSSGMIAAVHLFAGGELRTPLQVLICAQAVSELATIPRLVFLRRVQHRPIAVYETLQTITTTAVALVLACMGATLWALLSTDVAAAVVAILFFYVWRPVWRPRLAWKAGIVRYFIRFGGRTFLGELLITLIDRVDDLWTGAYLGSAALGFYSRAYRLAGYPRQLIAQPINAVASGVFAELKGDRRRLSQAFHYTMTLLIRGGFGLAGLMGVLSFELVHELLGEKWLPAVDIFRLLIVFCMLDAIRGAIASLFLAAGKPMELVKVRTLQLVLLTAGLFTLGRSLELPGVALAVDLMLVAGVSSMFWLVRRDVDLSLRSLFEWPLIALVSAIAVAVLALPDELTTGWGSALLKGGAFLFVYAGVLYLGEREALRDALAQYRAHRKRP